MVGVTENQDSTLRPLRNKLLLIDYCADLLEWPKCPRVFKMDKFLKGLLNYLREILETECTLSKRPSCPEPALCYRQGMNKKDTK